MDPVKRDGKIREQIDIEHECRRQYDRKWGWMLNGASNQRLRLYDPNYVNAGLQQSTVAASVPDVHTGHGQSYHMSAQMYNSLHAVCRCGRPKHGVHLLKCLQAQLPKVEPRDASKDDDAKRVLTMPKTSLGMYGWPPVSRFAQMQHATRYVSPTNDIPGGRLAARPMRACSLDEWD